MQNRELTFRIPLIIAAFAFVFLAQRAAIGQSVPDLVAQLRGEHCRFHYSPPEDPSGVGCRREWFRSPLTGLFSPHAPYECTAWAARCLSAMGSTAKDAVPALVHAIEHGPDDFETGDGPIPARTYVVEAPAWYPP